MTSRPRKSLVQNDVVVESDFDTYVSPFKLNNWATSSCNGNSKSSLHLALRSELFAGTAERMSSPSLYRRVGSASIISGTKYPNEASGNEMQGDNFDSYDSSEISPMWANLPVDIMSKVLEYLPISSHRVIRATCRGWNKAVGSTFVYLKPESVKNPNYAYHFPNLHTLDLSSADTEMICHWDNQFELVSGVKDEDLASIPHIRQLSALYLSNCSGLRGPFLDYASQLLHLKVLDLSGCSSMTNEYFIHFIPKFRKLESISLVGCEKLDDGSVEVVVDSLRHLRRFAVPPGTTDAGLHFLVRSKSLRRVGFRCCDNITPQGLKILLHMLPHIERVVVSKCRQISSSTLNRNIGSIGQLDATSRDTKYDQLEQNDCFLQKLRRRSLNMELMMEYFYH